MDLLGNEIEEHNIPPKLIYGADEAGFMTGVGSRERVIGPQGKSIRHQNRSGSHETIC